jgi:hypothetical protein
MEEEPNAEDDWGNVEEMDNDDDDHESNADERDDDDDDSERDNESDDDVIEDEIVEEFIRTFHNCNYDMEFDNALSLDRSKAMHYPRPTQESYNKPDNWQDRNRIGLEKVKEQLQTCIDLVSRHDQSVDLDLTHNIYEGQLMDNEEPIVWSEPVLDAYWNHFKAEIARRRQLDRVRDIRNIHFENVEITRERLAALVEIFRDGSLTNSSFLVKFKNANLCGEGMVWLSILVNVCSEMEILIINNNRKDSMDSARCLSRSLKSHTRIDHLDLSHCNLGSNLEILSIILQADVYRIILDHNNIDSLGAVTIAEYLESNPPICHIDLDHNRLNDDDASLISHALKRNTNLGQIDVVANDLTSVGVKALLTCVVVTSSLNTISESNHTLGSMTFFYYYTSNKDVFMVCIEKPLELDQFQKIVLALHDKDSLLKYLANIPVKLIPEVLAFPHGQIVNEHVHKHLSIVYSTMRWWTMPLQYSYHNCVKSDTKRKRSN